MATSDSVSEPAARIATSFPDDVDLDPRAVEAHLYSLIDGYHVT